MFKKITQNIKLPYLIIAGMVLFALFNGSLYNLIHNRMELSKLKKRNIELDQEFKNLEEELKKLRGGTLNI
ncbi:hypothetical protein AAIR98_000732 [Elusimicrobium simillimum]|uniref:hypothetical protein n=1 Tax=Elusimicrobium simillimum TaxID=3143438 RepID=UPI003C6FEA74